MNIHLKLEKIINFFYLCVRIMLVFIISGMVLSPVARLFGPNLNDLGVSNDLLGILVWSIATIFTGLFFFIRVHQNKKQNKQELVFAFLLALVLLICFVTLAYLNRGPRKEKTYKVHQAESHINYLGELVRGWTLYHEEIPGPDFSDVLSAIKNDEEVKWKLFDTIGPPFNEGNDSWGKPIIYRVRSGPDKSFIIRLHSYGPNQKDDSGKGDDIVQEVELIGPNLKKKW